MAVQLIIDAGSDLNAAEAQKMDVLFVPMTVRFGEEEFRSGVDLSNEVFYEKLAEAKELPTTSQPTPYDFECIYQKVADAGDTAVVLCVSSALSGTYQSANIAAADFDGCIYVVDTRAVTIGQRLLLEYAIGLKENGATAEEIFTALEQKKSDVRVYGVVESLEYLIKGGRLSKAAGAVGSVLGIRPVLYLCNGALAVAGKARGPKAAITMTHNLIKEVGIDFSMPMGFGYTGNDPRVIEPFAQSQNSAWQGYEVPVYNVGSTVGTHTGPGLFLAAFFQKT